MGDASTLVGFLHIELFSMILPALMVAFTAGMASGFTAGEESRGTIDVLLSFPISRRRLILEKTLALVLGCTAAAVVVWILAMAGAAVSASALPADHLAAALVMLVLLGLAFGALALAISVATGNRGAAIGVAVALMVAMYLVDRSRHGGGWARGGATALALPVLHGNDPLRNGLSLATRRCSAPSPRSSWSHPSSCSGGATWPSRPIHRLRGRGTQGPRQGALTPRSRFRRLPASHLPAQPPGNLAAPQPQPRSGHPQPLRPQSGTARLLIGAGHQRFSHHAQKPPADAGQAKNHARVGGPKWPPRQGRR